MVNDLPRLSSVNGIAHPHRPHDDTAAQIRAIAEIGIHLLVGAGCLIAWHGTGDAGTIRAVSDSHLNSQLDSLYALIQRDQRYRGYRANSGGGLLRLSNDELAAASGMRSHEGAYVAAAISISVEEELAENVTAILSAPNAHPACDLEAAVELLARSTINILSTRSATSSREFWRERAADFAARLAGSKAEESNGAAARDQIERTAAAAERLRPRNRFAGLGALFAKLGPFDAWILALAEDGALRKAASAGVLEPAAISGTPDSPASALAESFRRKSTMVRVELRAKDWRYREDGIFAHHSAGYICVPFASGAIALGAHEKIDDATVERVEAVARRVDPLIANWLLEAEAERSRRLMHNLGLRMFSAIDSERARIARDLHDHQAQLLAAARIGIEAGPDEARGIFKQLEDSLRLRVRELKPPTLGRSTLAEGLRYELRRLADCGIKTRLLHADRMNALTRPIQQLCYQVSREALANVVRHAHASRVEIGIEKHGSWVRLSILDNGTGIHDRNGRNGIGLDGLNERLALMGGRLRVESKTGATRLIAEIPEPS
jgi:signal transduction histidine kinase